MKINFSQLKIKPKLISAFLVVGIVPLMAVGFLSEQISGDALSVSAFNQLEGVRGIKKAQIEKFFGERKGDMGVLMETVANLRGEAFNKMTAIQSLKKAQIEKYMGSVRDDVKALASLANVKDLYQRLKQYHIDMHTGAKDAYDVSTAEYKRLYDEFGAPMAQFVKSFGYEEAYMICEPHGHVMFTVGKGPDLGTNVGHGPYKDSPLAELWNEVVETKDVAVVDFTPYEANDGAHRAFMGAPLYDNSGAMLGLVAIRIPFDPINSIVQRREGMSGSGESYLTGVWKDISSYRSNRVVKKGNNLGKKKNGNGIEKAYSGESGLQIKVGSTGSVEAEAYDPVNIEGLTWALVTSTMLEEIVSPKRVGDTSDFFTKYIEKYGYYDLFLIHPEGQVFYSVSKEADYQTNMVDGKYKDSGLGELTRKVLETKTFGIADFAPYAPSNGEPAAFIAQPVVQDGKVELIVALQLSLGAINEVMQQRDGMGETGETYLVGSDKLMRSDSFLDPKNHSVIASFADPSKGSVNTKAVEEALGGKTGSEIIIDYNGNPVLSAYTPLTIGDTTWALIAEIDEAEAFASIDALILVMTIMVLVAAAVIAGAGFLLARSVADPVVNMTSAMRELADGDKTIEIPAQDRGDEIGDMSGAVQVFKENMIKADKLAEEQREEEEARAERGRKIEQLCNDFDLRATEAVKSVAAAATEMQASSESMSATAEETSTQSATVAAASEQASANVQTVASAAEELSSSISEISRQVGQSSEIASNAVRQAEETNEKVQGLAEAANKIGEVVALITDIADQTNLLALNATIEAARAGDAGKGFAVVASEVKNLANQTGKATDEIGAQIANIQTATQEAVTAIEVIGKTISEVDEISTTIASAVEEQGAATQEIARNVEQAAAGTQEVSSNIGGVNQAASDTGAAATQIQSAAGELSQQSELLRAEVDKFLVNVRAA